MKMWSGRFRQPLDSDFERWQRSFGFDRRLLQYELAASSAHARALKDAGILSASELISILQGLQQIGAQAAASPAFLDDDEAEDVHHFVEKKLAASIGETGYKLHSGRSRNEQIATDLTIAAGGTATLTPTVPATAAPGATYARFRCASAGGLGPQGDRIGNHQIFRSPCLQRQQLGRSGCY